jgi:predicted phosphodiesterase
VRAAVISDVHSNLPALESALAAIDQETVDELWCLGDLVGYNADPEECTNIVLDRAAVCLAGNHDLVVTGAISSLVFTFEAGEAAHWSSETMSEAALARLRVLEPLGGRAGISLYHGSPRDPIWEYVIDEPTAAACLEVQAQRISLVGHSHIPLLYRQDGRRGATGGHATEGTAALGDGRCLLNPGSVGQPRDGDPRAAYLLLDLDRGEATWRRVEYDIERTQRSILDAGLPRSLAARLADGR